MPTPVLRPRVTVEAPAEFLDGEDWGFDLTFNDPGTGQPMDLSGSRLCAAFVSLSGLVAVCVCDSAAGDGSLALSSTDTGKASFLLAAARRTWAAPLIGAGAVKLPAYVVGDIYRRVGSNDWTGLARATLAVLPTTGRPPT